MSGTAGRTVEDTFRTALEEAAAERGGDPEVRVATAVALERLSCGTTATLVADDDTDRWAVLGGVVEALRDRGATAVLWPIGRRWGTALPLASAEALVAALAAVDPAFDSGQRPATSEDVAHEARLRLSSEALQALGTVLIVDAPEDAVGFSPGAILDEGPENGVRVLRSVREGAGGTEEIRLPVRGAAKQLPGTGGVEGLAAAVALALAPAPIPVLAAVAGVDPETVAAGLAEAVGPGGRLLVEGGGVTYRDSGWRAGVEASLAPAELARAHARFAEAARRAARGEGPGSDERAYWARCRAGHLVLSGAPWTAFTELVEPAWEASCAAVQASPRGRIEDARLARRAAQRAAAGIVEQPATHAGSVAARREDVEPGERARAAAFAVHAALVESSLRSRLWVDGGPLADSAAAAQLLASWAERVRGAARERLAARSREVARREPCSARALLAAATVSPSGERAALLDEALRRLPEDRTERLEVLCAAASVLGGEAPGATEHAAERSSGGTRSTEARSEASDGLAAADPAAGAALDDVLAQALALVSRELLGSFQRATASWPAALCARAVDATGPEHPSRRAVLALLSPRLDEQVRSAAADWVARDALAALASGNAWDASVYEDLRRVAPFVSLEVALEANAQRGLMDAPGSRRVMPALLERLRSLGAPVDAAAASDARQGAQARKGARAARASSSQGAAPELAAGAAGSKGAARTAEALAAQEADALAVQGSDRMAALAQAALALPPERAAALAELAVVAAEEHPPGDSWGYFLLAQLGGVLSLERAAQVLGGVLDVVTGAPLRSEMLWTGDGNDLRQVAPLLQRIGGDALLVDAGERVAEISARYT
ncbi:MULTISPECIES: hypothetical protein [Sorangium]|uniref:Uncharacterized protein n=1 Tax=Sorangium cellulosum TaxID=56 RepID=A0A4P2QG60_SORCE|nr:MULTISPECIES: hypothetical protein [Sorangium]AUX28877.1 uncharacterized protein SOCE836_009620 [Sorangium cellulosum]WCQ88273.1 hypothetical protein NQZ70_00948 [Sorangium sp. Soce836]